MYDSKTNRYTIYKLLHIPTSQFINYRKKDASQWSAAISTKNILFYNKYRKILKTSLGYKTDNYSEALIYRLYYGYSTRLSTWLDFGPIWEDRFFAETFLENFDIFLSGNVVSKIEFSIEEENIEI